MHPMTLGGPHSEFPGLVDGFGGDGWTNENGCAHLVELLGGSMRGLSGDGDLEVVREWIEEAGAVVGVARDPGEGRA